MQAQDLLKSGWAKLAGTIIVSLLAFWIGKSGEKTVEVPGQVPEPKIVTVVKLDTLTVYKPVLDVDTFIATAPDTCGQWLTRLRAEIIALRDSINALQAKSRPGSLTFADSTYFKPYRLWVWGQFKYPSGEGGILYHFEKTPYFHKSKFSVGGHIKFFRAPDAEIGFRFKGNQWLSITVQPSFKDNEFKTIWGAGYRWEF